MIMILSDGGASAAEAEKQMKLHGDKFFFYFSDVIAASRFGKGNVVIGEASRKALAKAYAGNKVKAVIDITEQPMSKLSRSALSACTDKIKYIKCVKCKRYVGAEICLSYRDAAERIRRCEGNTLMYAPAEIVSAVAELLGEDSSKAFVTVQKTAVFDTDSALEYGIPLLNVTEVDMLGGKEAAAFAIKKTGARLMVCTEAEDIEEKISTAKAVGIEVLVTHSMGIEYPKTVRNVRDAVIEVHNR